MTVRQVADKLASFVAKNGRQFENITRQRNPGDTPFKYEQATFFLTNSICFFVVVFLNKFNFTFKYLTLRIIGI